MRRLHRPGLRMRVTVAYVTLTAITSGLLALASYAVIEHHRVRNFAERARREVSLLALSSAQPSVAEFNSTIDRYRRYAAFDAVIIDADGDLSSTPSIDITDLPATLRLADLSSDEVRNATTEIDGESYLVVADRSVDDRVHYYFLYSRRDLLDGLREFRNVLLLGWTVAVVASAAFGSIVARRTLRPVASAARAAERVALGELDTRLTVRSNDELGRLAASFNTMTQSLDRKIQELSEAAERERGFTAAVAHDLRTPLTVMLSAAELLRDDLDALVPERSRRPLQLLIDDVHRLNTLVQELLELARLDAGQVDLEQEPFAIRDAVDAVVGAWDRTSTDGRVRIDVTRDLVALGDPGFTKRILANLVDNAAKHAGGATEIVGRRDGSQIRVDVKDGGPGLDDGKVERIFDRFYKSDSSRSRSGSGLGLALARHYAEVQGGSLVAGNAEDGGACFTLALPADLHAT